MSASLIFVGRDKGFGQYLCTLLQSRSHQQWSVKEFKDLRGIFSRIFALGDAGLVLLDFTGHASNDVSEDFCLSMSAFKRQQSSRAIPLVGIFESRKQLEQLEHLFTLGLNLSYIKGADAVSFANDLALLTEGKDDYLGKLVGGRALGQRLYVNALGAMVELTSEHVAVDADVLPVETEHVRFANFGERYSDSVQLIDFLPQASWHNELFYMQLRVNFPAPWEKRNTDTLTLNEMEEWLSHNQSERRRSVGLIYSTQRSILQHVLALPESTHLQVGMCDELNELKGVLKSLRPDVICLDLQQPEDAVDIILILKRVVAELKNWSPYVVIYHADQSSEEWRKIVKLDRTLAYRNQLTVEALDKFLAVASKLPRGVERESVHRFKLNDPARMIHFSIPMKLTGISEHEISFVCKEELPLYTILTLDFPVKMHLVVIPPRVEIEHTHKEGQPYHAIIHGLDERGERLLREYCKSLLFISPLEIEKVSPQTSELIPSLINITMKPLVVGKSKM